MPRIIRPGRICRKIYKGECPHCSCIFEAEPWEITKNQMVMCPTCKQFVKVEEITKEVILDKEDNENPWKKYPRPNPYDDPYRPIWLAYKSLPKCFN